MAALFVLGVLLGGVLLAKGRLLRQWSAADRQLEAVAVADRLLRDWSREDAVPIGERGTAGGGQWAWRCTARSDAEASRLNSRVVRLELYEADKADHAEPTLAVELLAPLEAEAGGGEER